MDNSPRSGCGNNQNVHGCRRILIMQRTVKISLGNSKLGKVPQVNLPPGVSCVRNIPCFNDGCYAKKSYRIYPSTREAWMHKWIFYIESPKEYFREIDRWLLSHTPELFRGHTSGDIHNQYYLDNMVKTCRRNPDTKFLCYTKNFSILH